MYYNCGVEKTFAVSQGVNTENVDRSRSLGRIEDFLTHNYAVSRSKYMTFFLNNISTECTEICKWELSGHAYTTFDLSQAILTLYNRNKH